MDVFSKKKKIYLICDYEVCIQNNISPFDYCLIALDSGVVIIQYRDKVNAKDFVAKTLTQLKQLFDKYDACLIVNDFADLAIQFALPLHLGQEDQLLQTYGNITFGRSTHSLSEIELALEEYPKPAYIGFGSVFKSDVKPQYSEVVQIAQKAKELWMKPIVFIGGITSENIQLLPQGENCYYCVLTSPFKEGLSKVKNLLADLVKKSNEFTS